MPCPYNVILGRDTVLPCPALGNAVSGAVGKRQCRVRGCIPIVLNTVTCTLQTLGRGKSTN